MSKDLLKEAIADAKLIKDAALRNAKLALEETFTPHIKEMIAAKIEEMDKSEEVEENISEEKQDVKEEFYEESGDIEETELSLEEILAELEAAEMEESKDANLEETKEEELEEAKEEDELDETIDLEALLAEIDAEFLAEIDAEEETEEEESEEDETESEESEEDEEIGEMTVEELKDLIRDIVNGVMNPGEEETSMDMGDEESIETDDLEIDLDEVITENEETNESETNEVVLGAIPDWEAIVAMLAPALGIGAAALYNFKDEIMAALKDPKKAAEVGEKIKQEVPSENDEALEELRNELNETNLLNAKLLYSNKIFRENTLNEEQKLRVINSFDKAVNVSEVKLIFEAIKDTFNSVKEKKQIKESFGLASKPTGASVKNSIIEKPDETVARMQKLAGII